nr:MAG: replication associated protein [Cressdnaviricota sp.]
MSKMTQPVDTAHSGNTNTECAFAKRARAWFVTSFHDPLYEFDNATYSITCDDTTEDGTYHFHQVVYFKNAVSWNSIKKHYPTANVRKCKSIYDSIHYIKDNVKGRKTNIKETGKEPTDTRFKSVKDLMDCNDPTLLDWKQFNTWKRIHENDELDIEDFHKDVKVYYICGPSGIGKTERAKQIIRDNKETYGTKFSNVKYEGSFWHGVNSKRNIALYDDFRDTHMKASEFINFIDYNVHLMNIKGGNCQNDYKLVIITSIQRPDEIYRNMKEEAREQWMRRMEVIDLYYDPDADGSDIEESID